MENQHNIDLSFEENDKKPRFSMRKTFVKRQSTISKDFKSSSTIDSTQKELQQFKVILKILEKPKKDRSVFDNKTLSQYLCERYDYFKKLKEESDKPKLMAVVSALTLESFQKNQKIITIGDDGDKFYILLKGTVGVYKPKLVDKLMTAKEFIYYLHYIKYTENDDKKLKRVEDANYDRANILKIKVFNYDFNQIGGDSTNKKNYCIEEDQKLNEKTEGDEFGEIALLQRVKRTATIKALSDCLIASIERSDYNKVIRRTNEMKYNSQVDILRKQHPVLKNWSKINLIKFINYFKKVRIGYGEILYKQGDNSDSIYIMLNGQFELTSNLHFKNYRLMIDYIDSNKTSVLAYLLKNAKVNEKDLENKCYQYSKEIFHPNFFMNEDDEEETRLKRIINSKGQLLNLKLKEEQLKSNSKLISVRVRLINNVDILGMEDSLEFKKRFCTVKCTSPYSELYRINIEDFINLINSKEVDHQMLMNVIKEKKTFIINQITNLIKVKVGEVKLSLNREYDVFYKKEEKIVRMNAPKNLKIKRKIQSKDSDYKIIEKKFNENKKKLNLFRSLESLNFDLEKFNSGDLSSLIESKRKGGNSIYNSNKTLKLIDTIDSNNFNEFQRAVSNMKKKIDDKSDEETFNKKFDANKYSMRLSSIDFDSLTQEISKVVGTNVGHSRNLKSLSIFDKKLLKIEPLQIDGTKISFDIHRTEIKNNLSANKINNNNSNTIFRSRNQISTEAKMKYFKLLKTENNFFRKSRNLLK